MLNSFVQRLAVLLVVLFLSIQLANVGYVSADVYVDDTYYQPEVSFEQMLKDADNLQPKYDRNMKEFIFQSVDSVAQDTTQINSDAL
ncbi:MAG: hypothetical protein IJ756_03745 [Paludibacteraceae bacterium]|nr:hypothetical protein [Paludibacteraceae bacterium]MBR1786258.1 hypothetical protein [Paludibacteraceae bacterium]